jgi:putative holliday junction resolvase
MRFVGVDLGQRRIGLAISDTSSTLARPWRVIPAGPSPVESARLVLGAVDDYLRELDEPGIEGLVVGLPRRLNGSDTHQTQGVRAFAAAVTASGGPRVHLQDERLSSREAEALLAEREPDWRERKKKLDAAAAAIVLQDFLDWRSHEPSTGDVGH